MNVMILSSSKEEINDYYKSIARSISKYLASLEYDLVYGAASVSMMGICYEEFIKQNRDVHAFTTEKYIDDLVNLPQAHHYIRETTFDMKKSMFENSDLVVALPGGTGTLSEILAFMEENRSNDKNIPIIIYDEDNYYQKLFELLNNMKEHGFITEEINNHISIAHNKEEFEEFIYISRIKGRKI